LRKFLVLGLVLFALLIQPLASAEEPSESTVYRITQVYEVSNQGPGTASNVRVTIYVLDNWSGWVSQEILVETLPAEQVSETEDNRFIQISFGTLGPGDRETVTVIQTVRIDSHDMQLDPGQIGDSVPPGFGHTSPVANLWESNEPDIENRALELVENQPNFYYKAKAIFEFVKGYLTYRPSPEIISAFNTYRSRMGDCAEYANLFIALCRAAGIPAKFVSCYAFNPEFEPDLGRMGHAFAIVYLPNAGWVPVDLTWPLRIGQFGTLDFTHIISATSSGGDMFGWAGNVISPDASRVTSIGGSPLIELSGEIIREVAVDATLSAALQMIDRTWRFYVTVKNAGTRVIENIRVELQADENYFEVPQAQTISRLEAGHNQQVSFDVYVKASVEKSPIQALIIYDNPYGTFAAKSNRVLASPTIPELPQEIMNLIWIVLFATIAGAAIAVVVAVARRR
jgi:transglutaminase/protease-like cytokinesis protein 3